MPPLRDAPPMTSSIQGTLRSRIWLCWRQRFSKSASTSWSASIMWPISSSNSATSKTPTTLPWDKHVRQSFPFTWSQAPMTPEDRKCFPFFKLGSRLTGRCAQESEGGCPCEPRLHGLLECRIRSVPVPTSWCSPVAIKTDFFHLDPISTNLIYWQTESDKLPLRNSEKGILTFCNAFQKRVLTERAPASSGLYNLFAQPDQIWLLWVWEMWTCLASGIKWLRVGSFKIWRHAM